MLIENKFLFISLPRCASTSFFLTSLKYGLNIKHDNPVYDNQLEKIENWKTMENEDLIDILSHSHESITNLEKKFGHDFPIISIKRNRHERFISLWKHIIDETHRIKEFQTFENFKKLSIDDILFFNSNEVIEDNIFELVHQFSIKNKLNIKNAYIVNMLFILFKPTSFWHNHNNKIIWFDINELNKLEEWVSKTLSIDFKMEKTNSSQKYDSNIKNNEYFQTKYNSIYNQFDLIKDKTTVI
jgi:hypothetical protein